MEEPRSNTKYLIRVMDRRGSTDRPTRAVEATRFDHSFVGRPYLHGKYLVAADLVDITSSFKQDLQGVGRNKTGQRRQWDIGVTGVTAKRLRNEKASRIEVICFFHLQRS